MSVESQRAANRRYYERNREAHIARAQRRKQLAGEAVRRAKERPCADCGVQYPYYVMDFDHRDGEEKVAMLSKMWWSASVARVEAEIAKCDLVCANCHRQRTHERAQNLLLVAQSD